MVLRPGTTGSEDGHQIKQEPEARAPTTDGSSPDTQLAMRPASPHIHEGTSVAPDIKVEVKAPDIKVEVKKEEYEEKYPVSVMASPEAIKGSATQQSPPGSSGMPMKAPDEEEEEMKAPAPLPQLTASLAHQFGIQELGRLLLDAPVLMALDARTSSRLHGPISIPRIDEVYTTLEAVRMLLTLLEESGLQVRTRDLSALASFDVDAVTNTIRRLFHTLGEIVGIAMKREPSPRQAPSPRRHKATAGSSTGSSRYRSVSSIVDESDSGSTATERMAISPEAPPFRPAEAAPAAALPSTQSTRPLPAMHSSNVPGMQPDMFQRALDALVRATSDLKSFSGRDATEEKSRTWLNKLQSAAKRDGMSPAEMCLLMNDLITGPARQWYLQLSRDIRSSWNDLSSQFQYQYCGKGVSVARKYYHATKRSDETPLEYLHRLTVAGIRAKLRVKDGNAAER
ncbi:hypothetical protein PF003_g23796 [Phytophthora fragariae]|nr:hypothetical protein PF003_g23796 [Phytophthora fragariae]